MPRYAILPISGYLEVSNAQQGRELLAEIAKAGMSVELVEIRCLAQYQAPVSPKPKCDEPTDSAD